MSSFLLCANRGAVEFLKKLASQTGGRFHCSSGGEDGQLAAHRILTGGLDDEDVREINQFVWFHCNLVLHQ